MMDNIIQGKKYRITVLSEILLRLEYSESGIFLDELTELVRNRNFNKVNFDIKQDEKYLVIETKYFKLEYVKEKPFVGTKFVPEANLKVLLKDTDRYWYYNHVEARNFKTIGVSIDNINNIKLNNNGLYSTDGFVSIDDSKSLILKNDEFYKRSNEQIDIYLFMYKRDFGLVLRDYFNLTNKPIMIPRYMFGNIWNKDTYYTDQNIINLINKFNKNNIPINYVLLGNEWHIKNNATYGLNWNKDLFINYDNFINFIKSNGIYLGVTINPMEISNKEINIDRFLKDNNISVDNNNVLLNIYNKSLMDSYFKIFIEPLISSGVNGFLIDYTNIKDLYSLRVLNYYHSKYFKDNNLKVSLLSRNGLVNSHSSNIIYTGKSLVSWDVLNKLPEYNASGSNIGLSFISNDIGGYYGGIEDDELYRRYIQFGTFSPILRLSSASSHYYKREPWKWDIDTLSVVTYYLRLRNMLIPYIYTESYNYSNTGIPLIQPLYYKYPQVYDEVDYRNEYYFGNNLFVSPITKKKDIIMNRTVHKMFLPEGVWYDIKTGIKYVGNKRYISFYKDEDYPVFANSGTILPLGVIDDNNINSSKNPKGFEIHIFPGKSNTYTIYEDDGITNNNNYVKTIIDYNYMLNNYTVIIRQDVTDSSLVPNIRSYKILFRNTRMPNDISVYLQEDKLDNYKYYSDENDFILEINNVNTFKQITINCKGQDIEIETSRIINKDIDDIISDLKIETVLKSEVSKIMFSDLEIKNKRIKIRKLKRVGLNPRYINMFLKLLEYIEDNV